MKFSDIRTEAIHLTKTLGLDPESYLDPGDERINKKAHEYLIPLAAKLSSIRAKEENRSKIEMKNSL